MRFVSMAIPPVVRRPSLVAVTGPVTVPSGVTVKDLSQALGISVPKLITFLMGLAFVLGQANEYRVQYGEGNKLSTDGYGSVFYLTTGFHGLHVIGGLFAFIIVLGRTVVGRYTPEKATSAIVVSYYWHFVDVVWIGLYTTIYILQ